MCKICRAAASGEPAGPAPPRRPAPPPARRTRRAPRATRCPSAPCPEARRPALATPPDQGCAPRGCAQGTGCPRSERGAGGACHQGVQKVGEDLRRSWPATRGCPKETTT
ncbi:atherin-like [Vulpes lagopus]|uniref:atherin-like n=1 Tax=Vulpes lagopus TaxID=494514 RepID=UPI001BC97C5B|nr:atherin-like [Vulpes lagopus]